MSDVRTGIRNHARTSPRNIPGGSNRPAGYVMHANVNNDAHARQCRPLAAGNGNIRIAFPRVSRHIMRPMAKTSKKTKRTPNAAFMKPVTPDEKLAKVVGDKPLPRTELTKKLWVYIRKNGLQDKKVRTQINADDALKAVFNGKKSVSMFEMTKLVSGHLAKK